MFSFRKAFFITVFFVGIFFYFHQSAFAGICNPFDHSGSCGNSTCDSRTQYSSDDACFGNGNCCYVKDSYPSSCVYSGQECQCTGEAGFISSTCLDGKPQNFDCGGGGVCVSPGYTSCESGLNDLGSFCPRLGHNCSTGWTFTYANDGADNDCDRWGNNAICCTIVQECNVTSTNSACNANNVGANTCGHYGGTITKTYQQYKHAGCFDTSDPAESGYTCTPSSVCTKVNGNAGTSGCTTGFQNHCSNNYTCQNGGGGPEDCVTTITVHIYIDYGHDGSQDANYPFGVVKLDGGNAQTTGADGTVTYGGLTTGTYTISYADNSPDYQQIGATTQNVNLTNNNGDVTVNFRVTPLYKISGNVFNDLNKDQNYNGSDTLFTGNSTIHVSGGPTAVGDMSQTDGTYDTGEILQSGTYTLAQTHSLPGGYNYTTPSSWSVTVGDRGTAGPNCTVNTSPDGVCGNPNDGSISGLNFGLTNENPWQQSACFDVRDDSGSYTNEIPAAPSCGGVSGPYTSITNADCSTGAGIVFTCDATPDFGLGSANAQGWQAGGPGGVPPAQQAECFTGAGLDIVRTSYSYLLTTAQESGITPIDMSTVCGGNLDGCALPHDLARGVYKAEGDVHLDASTIPVDSSRPQSFIFLIHGNLYIDGDIIVPAGSVAAFSASGNIYVDKSVGNVVTNTDDPAVNNPNIEGLYSADGSFIIQSYGVGTNICNLNGTPLDKKLNVIGSIVTNAAQSGGSLVNNRDLCIYDLACSPVSYGDGLPDGNGASDEGLALSYITTLYGDGSFLNHKLFNWEELKP